MESRQKMEHNSHKDLEDDNILEIYGSLGEAPVEDRSSSSNSRTLERTDRRNAPKLLVVKEGTNQRTMAMIKRHA